MAALLLWWPTLAHLTTMERHMTSETKPLIIGAAATTAADTTSADTAPKGTMIERMAEADKAGPALDLERQAREEAQRLAAVRASEAAAAVAAKRARAAPESKTLAAPETKGGKVITGPAA